MLNRFEYALSGNDFGLVGAPDAVRLFDPNVGSLPELTCDVNLARSLTKGCVFTAAAAVFSLDENNPQSAGHIREALRLANMPGRYVAKENTRAIAGAANPLNRTRVLGVINSNRSTSHAACRAEFTGAPATCPVTTDPDKGVEDGPCDCDEYPPASTLQGGRLLQAQPRNFEAFEHSTDCRVGQPQCWGKARRVLYQESDQGRRHILRGAKVNTAYLEQRVDIDVVIAMLRQRQNFVMEALQWHEHDLPWDFDQVERILRDPGPIPALHQSAGQSLNREQASLSLAHAVRNTSVFVRGPEELQLVVYVVIDLELRPDLAAADPLDEKYVWTKFWDIEWHQRELALIQLRLFSSSGTSPVDTQAFLKQFEMDFAAALVPELAGVETWGQVSSDVLRPNWGHGCSLLQMLRLRYGTAFSRAVEATPTYQALNRLWHAVLWNADPWTSAQLLELVNFHEAGAQGLLRLGPRSFRCDPIADRAREFDELADDISRDQARAMLERRARHEAKLAVEALRKSQPLPDLPPDWVGAAGAPLTRLYTGNFPVFYGMGTIEPEGMDNAGDHFSGQVNGMLGTAMAPLLHFNTGLHTGKVHLAIWLAEVEPPLPHEAWDELVEAPYHVEPGHKLYLRDWEGSLAKRLRLPPGSYRVRMGAARMGQAQNWPDGRDNRQRPIERYALAFWPAPQQPDAVLREACSFAKDGHDLTRQRSEEAARQHALARAGELA